VTSIQKAEGKQRCVLAAAVVPRPRSRGQAVDPFTGGDRLATGFVGTESRPIPFLLNGFVGNGSLYDEDEGIDLKILKRLHSPLEEFTREPGFSQRPPPFRDVVELYSTLLLLSLSQLRPGQSHQVVKKICFFAPFTCSELNLSPAELADTSVQLLLSYIAAHLRTLHTAERTQTR